MNVPALMRFSFQTRHHQARCPQDQSQGGRLFWAESSNGQEEGVLGCHEEIRWCPMSWDVLWIEQNHDACLEILGRGAHRTGLQQMIAYDSRQMTQRSPRHQSVGV